MNKTRIPKSVISTKERRLSLFLLCFLILIAGTILALQSRYDAGRWREQSQPEALPQRTGVAQDTIEGLKPLSLGEKYDATTLSDKINGKADLYLTAGFKQLESRRFGLTSDPGRWMERYVYHMDGYRSAFAVFSAQRRTDIQPLKLTAHAYLSANGLFMVHGPFYVEIIAAEVSEEMRAGAVKLARTFTEARKVEVSPLDELALFPKRGRVTNSRMLNADSVFGLDGLNWVFTCRYAEAGHEATAFISKRASVAEAGDLAQAFSAYWQDYGGETVAHSKTWANVKVQTILDNYEIVWVQGEYLLGVHEATDLDFGLALADRLRQAVRESRHAP